MEYVYDYNQQVTINFNQIYALYMPFSEVNMFMNIAGKVKLVELLPNGMVQLYELDGSEFSFPITYSEAGIYQNQQTREYYSFAPKAVI